MGADDYINQAVRQGGAGCPDSGGDPAQQRLQASRCSKIGNLQLNLDSRDVLVDGNQVHLTGKEIRPFWKLLVLRKGMVLTKESVPEPPVMAVSTNPK